MYETRVWERLSDILEEDPVVRVPEFEGSFQLDARSHVLRRVLLDGTYEPALARVCRMVVDPQRDAVDVGANAGFFSVLLARLIAGRVLAIEPTPTMSHRLRANLERNGVADRVSVVEAVATSMPGTAIIHAMSGKEEYATIGDARHPALMSEADHHSQGMQDIPVQAVRLDDLVAECGLRPGFIKIDVEGAEPLVLAGAARVIEEHRPVLLLEVNDALLRGNGSSARNVVQDLLGWNYRFYDPHAQDLLTVSIAPETLIERLETPHELEDLLAIPAGS